MTRYLICALPVACAIALAGSLAAQQPLSREEALAFTWPALEGFPPAPVVQRVLADSGTLRFYDDLLNGREAFPRGGDTATVLYFLACSGQKRFLPTLLRFAVAPKSASDWNAWDAATFGLVMLAHIPEARSRLLTFTGSGEPALRRDALILLLIKRNTPAARDILRQVYVADLPVRTQSDVKAALARPPGP